MCRRCAQKDIFSVISGKFRNCSNRSKICLAFVTPLDQVAVSFDNDCLTRVTLRTLFTRSTCRTICALQRRDGYDRMPGSFRITSVSPGDRSSDNAELDRTSVRTLKRGHLQKCLPVIASDISPLENTIIILDLDITAIRTGVTLRTLNTLRTLRTLSTLCTCSTGITLLTCQRGRRHDVDPFSVGILVLDVSVIRLTEIRIFTGILKRADRHELFPCVLVLALIAINNNAVDLVKFHLTIFDLGVFREIYLNTRGTYDAEANDTCDNDFY